MKLARTTQADETLSRLRGWKVLKPLWKKLVSLSSHTIFTFPDEVREDEVLWKVTRHPITTSSVFISLISLECVCRCT